MKGKALVSSLLAFALTVSMVTPAFAAGNATDVTLTVETDETPSTVSVKVPAVIPLHMDKQGVVSVEGDLKIENLSEESGVSVTGIEVSGKSGWQVVDYSYDASAEPLNTEKIGMSFNGDQTTAGGSVTLTDGSWNISAQGQLPLVVDAKVPKRDAAPEQSSIAAVNWSFKVDEGGVVPPDESSAISNDWDAGSKMLTGGVRPVTFSWDSTAEDASIVSVSAEDDGVVSVAASMAEMPYNGSATYNVTAKAKGTTKVTATLSTGETSEFTVEVCEVKAEGGGDITINVPGTGLKPGDKPGDITIDIPVTGPDGDTTITVKPEIPGDTTLNPGDNEIEVDVTVDGVTIHITIIIRVESDNPSDGLNQSVEEAQAMGFTFSPYGDGLQIDSFENKQFKSEINVPEQIGDFKVLKIGDGVFQGQSNLTKVTLPSTVTVVGAGAFKDCGKLNSFIIPDSCTDIGDEAFYNCVELATVSLPEGLTEIRDSLFYGCTGLTSVNIPNTVTRIENNAFKGCAELETVVCDAKISSFGGSCFADCSKLVATFSTSATSYFLSGYAFEGCKNITLYLNERPGTNMWRQNSGIKTIYCQDDSFVSTKMFDDISSAKYYASAADDGAVVYLCSGDTQILVPKETCSGELIFQDKDLEFINYSRQYDGGLGDVKTPYYVCGKKVGTYMSGELDTTSFINYTVGEGTTLILYGDIGYDSDDMSIQSSDGSNVSVKMVGDPASLTTVDQFFLNILIESDSGKQYLNGYDVTGYNVIDMPVTLSEADGTDTHFIFMRGLNDQSCSLSNLWCYAVKRGYIKNRNNPSARGADNMKGFTVDGVEIGTQSLRANALVMYKDDTSKIISYARIFTTPQKYTECDVNLYK